jgi:hypothetical protein
MEATCYCFCFLASLLLLPLGILSNLLNQSHRRRRVHPPIAWIGSRPCSGEFLKWEIIEFEIVSKAILSRAKTLKLKKTQDKKSSSNINRIPLAHHLHRDDSLSFLFVLKKITLKAFLCLPPKWKRRKFSICSKLYFSRVKFSISMR